jgi:hypothetical protein
MHGQQNTKLFHTKVHYNLFSCCISIQTRKAILIRAMQGYKHAYTLFLGYGSL